MATTPNYTYLMASIGAGLHAWSQVETAMGLLFYNVSGISDMARSGAIYDAIIAFEARVAVLDAAVQNESKLLDDEKEIWANLSSRLRKLYRKRHEIAHFSLPPGIVMDDATAFRHSLPGTSTPKIPPAY